MPGRRLNQSVGGGLPRWVYRALSPRITALDDFRGGLNLTDYPFVAPNELIQAYNIEIDRSGSGVTGLPVFGTRIGNQPPGGGNIIFAVFSAALDTNIVLVNGGAAPGWYRTGDFFAYTLINATGAGGPATANFAMAVDFNGELVIGTIADGIFALSSAWTWTVCTTAIKPYALAVWQNKVWAIGDSANKTRVWACNAGNSHVWTTATDWVDIREPGDDPCIAIVSTQQQDYQGRPSLLIYKNRSVHRINSANATTGFSFTTLTVGTGCFSRWGGLAVGGVVLSIDDNGVWATDGLSVPQNVATKVAPIFAAYRAGGSGVGDRNSIAFQRDGVAYWHIPGQATAVSKQLLAYDSRIGAFSLVRDVIDAPAFTYSNYQVIESRTTTNGRMFYMFRYTGIVEGPLRLFDTVTPNFATPSRLQTAWLEFAQGGRFVARRARIWGRLRENLTVTLYTNFLQTAVQTYTITGDGATPSVRPRDLWSLGKPRALSLQFDYTPAAGASSFINDPTPAFAGNVGTAIIVSGLLLSRISFKTASTSAE